MREWTFEERGHGGVLKLDGREIATLTPAPPGHVIDTGHRIATALHLLDLLEARRPVPSAARAVPL